MPHLNAFQEIGYVSLKDEQKIYCYATHLLPEGNICIFALKQLLSTLSNLYNSNFLKNVTFENNQYL